MKPSVKFVVQHAERRGSGDATFFFAAGTGREGGVVEVRRSGDRTAPAFRKRIRMTND